MRGVPGLLIAVGLAIVGAFCNWLYLAQKGQELAHKDFVAIAEETKINIGDRFTRDHFQKVSIPSIAVGNLDKSAFTWGELDSVVGMAATRSFSPGEIVLRQYVLTPPQTDIKKLLAPDERVLWIPVDTRTFVASLVNAGDQVSFIVPRLAAAAAPAPVTPDSPASGAKPRGTTQTIGPFRILALGNRMGSQEVMRAHGATPSQENVMAIAVKVVGGELDELGQQISDLLRLTNFQQVQVLLHPSAESTAKTR